MSRKNVFLERYSQNSQKNTCDRDSILIKLQAYGCKKETLIQVFSREFCEISKNTFLTEHLRTTATAFSSMKKGALGNFAKFTGKHLGFAKFSKTPFLQNTFGRVLLAFLCNVTKMGYCQQCLENHR